LNAEHRAALAAAIEAGPTPAIHGVVRWRIVDLVQWLQDEFEIAVSKQTLGRELRAEDADGADGTRHRADPARGA
jgi:hypothetical protein